MSDDRFEVEGIHCDDDERVSGKRFSTSNYHEIRTPAYLKQMHNGKIPDNGLVELGYESRKDLEKDQNFKCVVMKDGQPFSNDEITSLCQTKRKEIREKFNLAKTNIGTYYDDDSSGEIV